MSANIPAEAEVRYSEFIGERMWMALVFIACGTGGPDPAANTPELQREPRMLEPAGAVAAADLDGDGFDEEILVQAGVVYWMGGEEAIDCTVQVTARRTVSGGGREEALLGCGAGRETRNAPARILAVGENGLNTLWSRDGERNQFSDIRVLNNEIWRCFPRSSRWKLAGFGRGSSRRWLRDA